MPASRFFVLCLLLLLPLASPVPASEGAGVDELRPRLGNEWRLTRHDRQRNIRTYAKLEDDQRIRSFRVEGVLKARVETLTRVLLDFSGYRDWYWDVQECRLLKQVSSTEYYVYLIHRAPRGLPDRDVVLHAQVEPQTSARSPLLITVKAAPDLMPAQPPLVRMPAENMTVRLTPLPGELVRIEAEGFIDPGGRVPSWDANLIQRNAPYAVVLGLQRMALQQKYQFGQTALPFPVYNHDSLSPSP